MNEHETPPQDTPDVKTSQQTENLETTATTGPAQDPWNLLMNAGSDGGIWMLLGGPFLILLVIAATYTILVAIKRRRETREFIKDVEEAEDPRVVALPTSAKKDPLDTESVEPLTGQPIKQYKVPQDLQEDEDLPPHREKASVHALFPAKKPAERDEKSSLTDSSRPKEKTEIPSQLSFKERLRQGMTKTREAFQSQLIKIFSTSPSLDDKVLEQLHETLYRADFGVETADQLILHVKNTLKTAPKEQPIINAPHSPDSWENISQALRQKTASILKLSHETPLRRPDPSVPWVILIVGVNGVGKTTTIGKLAAHFKAQGQTCLLVAADTFRAAAIEQLSVWGERLDVDVIRHQSGADPAAVAFDGVKAGIARKTDVILIDTAGRLHAKTELMAELGKINRILGRDLPGAPHETWLVIDATTGQNAVAQVKAFKEVVNLSGLVVTKLDGTAKGGVIVGITQQYKIPVRFIGIGEKADDLRPFSPDDFADTLF